MSLELAKIQDRVQPKAPRHLSRQVITQEDFLHSKIKHRNSRQKYGGGLTNYEWKHNYLNFLLCAIPTLELGGDNFSIIYGWRSDNGASKLINLIYLKTDIRIAN